MRKGFPGIASPTLHCGCMQRLQLAGHPGSNSGQTSGGALVGKVENFLNYYNYLLI